MSGDQRRPPVAEGSALRELVQAHYGERARGAGCCGADAGEAPAGPEEVPSFGCGDPNASAALAPGEVVLDLGSGAG